MSSEKIERLGEIWESVTEDDEEPEDEDTEPVMAEPGTVWVVMRDFDPLWESPDASMHKSRACAESNTSRAAKNVSIGHASQLGYTECGRCF